MHEDYDKAQEIIDKMLKDCPEDKRLYDNHPKYAPIRAHNAKLLNITMGQDDAEAFIYPALFGNDF